MEPTENRTQSDDPARIARREESLVALYVELTGASANQARSVYAHLEVDDSLDRNRAWSNEPLIPPQKLVFDSGNRVSIKDKFQRGGGLFEPGTASVRSAAGTAR